MFVRVKLYATESRIGQLSAFALQDLVKNILYKLSKRNSLASVPPQFSKCGRSLHTLLGCYTCLSKEGDNLIMQESYKDFGNNEFAFPCTCMDGRCPPPVTSRKW